MGLDRDRGDHGRVERRGLGVAGGFEPRGFVPAARRPQRVCFPFLAQIHQTPHSLPIGVELARRHPQIEVHLAAPTEAHLAFVRRYVERVDGRGLSLDLLAMPRVVRDGLGPSGHQVLRKWAALALNRAYFDAFDAVVVPERTSYVMRRLGVARPRLILTRHGAGDRAGGFTPTIGRFDFVIMAGAKLERRLLAAGLIRQGDYVTGVYAKFDFVRAMASGRRLFDNNRPTIVYNPHFRRSLSSWPLVGRQLLDWAAGQQDFNLVFAPHMRLFDPPTARKYAPFEAYARLPHIRIDLGSPALVDMTYTLGADIYLGDVSSQVSEFVTRPRPCVFLNPRGLAWTGDPSFRFWELGEVVEEVGELPAAIARAIARQPQRAPLQADYVRDSFGAPSGPTAHLGADAIAAWLGPTGRAGPPHKRTMFGVCS